MPKTTKSDLSGKKFGRLTVLRFIPDDSRYSAWWCVCDCGKEKKILGQSLNNGATLSCGCLNKELTSKRIMTHGEAGSKNKKRSPTYKIWAGMMDRCEWGNNPSFKFYGAKGVRVCKRWHSYENFLADMGARPEGKSIDRIDNTKGYEPGNCRWATRKQQDLNTSRTIKVVYYGKLKTAYELCEQLGISRKALRSRAVRRNNDYVAAFQSIGVFVEKPT